MQIFQLAKQILKILKNQDLVKFKLTAKLHLIKRDSNHQFNHKVFLGSKDSFKIKLRCLIEFKEMLFIIFEFYLNDELLF